VEHHGPAVPPLAPLAPRGHLALTLPELVAWGERFGRVARAPLVVALAGDLGAGKTTLAQAICRGYGVTEPVTSPTYAIVHEYHAPASPVYHLDLYRLERPDDLVNIGWDEVVAARALVLVEWPERAAGRLPPDAVPIDLEHLAGDPDRRLLLAG
jgi:tRNA threonylcarbamoyladenosine biosynthesis protein TsaE